MRYEMTTLSVKLGTAPAVLEGVRAFTRDGEARGELLGVFTTDIGQLDEIHILRSFADNADFAAERKRTANAANPFGAAEHLVGLSRDIYTAFPSLPPVRPGKFGAVYEIRTYKVKLGAHDPLVQAWEAALPARLKLSPLLVAMITHDGPQRLTHIWPYASLNDRAAIRAEAVSSGVWPPKGGPSFLTGDMRSTIVVPAAFSPLS